MIKRIHGLSFILALMAFTVSCVNKGKEQQTQARNNGFVDANKEDGGVEASYYGRNSWTVAPTTFALTLYEMNEANGQVDAGSKKLCFYQSKGFIQESSGSQFGAPDLANSKLVDGLSHPIFESAYEKHLEKLASRLQVSGVFTTAAGAAVGAGATVLFAIGTPVLWSLAAMGTYGVLKSVSVDSQSVLDQWGPLNIPRVLAGGVSAIVLPTIVGASPGKYLLNKKLLLEELAKKPGPEVAVPRTRPSEEIEITTPLLTTQEYHEILKAIHSKQENVDREVKCPESPTTIVRP